MTTPAARALLDLFDNIPWSQNAALDAGTDRLVVRLRSSQTLSEMVRAQGWNTADADTRYLYGRQIEAAEADPHRFWEQDWRLTQPSLYGHMADKTLEQWAAYEAKRFPSGFYPVRVDRRELDAEVAASVLAELRSGPLESRRSAHRPGTYSSVRDAAARVTAAGAELDAAKAARAEEIRAALRAGVSAIQVAEITGVGRARIYQIRDGVR